MELSEEEIQKRVASMKDRVVIFSFSINGTDANPFERYGLSQNPFSSIGKYEYDRVAIALNSLGGEPIKAKDDFFQRLRPHVIDEMIENISSLWVPGKMVKVKLYFDPVRDENGIFWIYPAICA